MEMRTATVATVTGKVKPVTSAIQTTLLTITLRTRLNPKQHYS